MKKIILWAWQLPQHLLGLLFIKIFKAKGEPPYFYYVYKFGDGASVSLGQYRLIHEKSVNSKWTVGHEYGHSKQSLMLGPLYLLIIALPSVIGNIYSRIKHKNSKWYYAQPWEAWADKLGKVDRTKNAITGEPL